MPVLPRLGYARKTKLIRPLALVDGINSGSFLHRLDPRTKLVLGMLFTVLVFVIDSLPVSAALMLLFAALCRSAHIPLKKIFPHWRFLVFLALLVLVLQVLFGQGLVTGLMVCCRIASLTILLPTLTATTGARQLAWGITRLGLHYKAAHVITSTLNLIPSFEEETRLILQARRLRGIRSFENGGLFAKLREYGAVTLPLMIKAMRKAQIVSLAMDTRAFGAHTTRTWLFTTRMSAIDYTAFACGIAFSAVALTAQFLVQ